MVAGWTRIGRRPGGELVLAVDFDGSGRREATFRDLAQLLPDDLDVWHTVLPPARAEQADQYIDWWLERPARHRTPVRAVFGYCAGSTFAAALGEAISADQGCRPAVVLFNPAPPGVDTLDRDLRSAIESMTVLSSHERAELHRRAELARRRHGDDFDAVSAGFVDIYRAACDAAFARMDVDPDIAGELVDLFRSYVAYLVAARDVRGTGGRIDATALTAREHHGSTWARTEIRFDLGRAELLRDGGVAKAAYALLANGA